MGRRVRTQRYNKSKNLLSQDYVERLEALAEWSWDPVTEQWEEAFEQLQSYVKLHGNARISANYVTPDGFNLGTWITTQRQNKSKNLLSQDRIERFEALSGWSWDRLEQWEEGFEQLQSYVKLYGNARVSVTYVTPDGFNLGTWITTQRQNKSKNLLTQDRIERFEALSGWSWVLLTEKWEEAFEQLQFYVKLNGDARVPALYVTLDGLKLGRWVTTQRQNKSKNLLSQDRIERFEALSGWSWDLITEKWEEAFEQLQSYVKLNGDARVPATHIASDELNLGTWVRIQRQNKSKNLLSQDRIERLEALSGWVWSFKKESK
ncbi:helicase associated domain-containing protein [Methylobacter sp. Wu8]|uniref:helicase associated domain-containing protein n=1 Tax=Methylobacter sp. Wu8 TaxID=3118457 RepID=UPI002F330472